MAVPTLEQRFAVPVRRAVHFQIFPVIRRIETPIQIPARIIARMVVGVVIFLHPFPHLRPRHHVIVRLVRPPFLRREHIRKVRDRRRSVHSAAVIEDIPVVYVRCRVQRIIQEGQLRSVYRRSVQRTAVLHRIPYRTQKGVIIFLRARHHAPRRPRFQPFRPQLRQDSVAFKIPVRHREIHRLQRVLRIAVFPVAALRAIERLPDPFFSHRIHFAREFRVRQSALTAAGRRTIPRRIALVAVFRIDGYILRIDLSLFQKLRARYVIKPLRAVQLVQNLRPLRIRQPHFELI